MKYNIGTKVRLIHTGDIATIIDYIDALSVLVELEDGDEIPVDLEDMTTEMKYVPKVTKKVVKESEPITKTYLKLTNTGISIHFEPIYFADDTISHFKASLINDSPKVFVFSFEMKLKTSVPKTKSDKIQSGQTYYLNDLTIEQLNDNPQVKLDLWQITTEGTGQLLTKTIKLKAKHFFQSKGKSPLSNKAGYTLSVFKKFNPPPKRVLPNLRENLSEKSEEDLFTAPEVIPYFDKTVKTYTSLTHTGFSIHFQPHKEDGFIQHYNTRLINDSEKNFIFSFTLKTNTSVPKTVDGKILAGQVFPMIELSREVLSENAKITLQLWEISSKGTTNPLSRTISLKAKKFALAKDLAPLCQQKGYTLFFFEKFEAKRKGTKSDLREAIVPTKKSTSKVFYSSQSGVHPSEYAAFPHEVDLHIEQLTKRSIGKMTNAEILRIQEDHFYSYIREAIRVGVDRVFIIHGVGEGKLKSRIFEILDNMKEVKSFKNEYHVKYGFGATEVIFS